MIIDNNLVVSGTLAGTALSPTVTGQGPITATVVSTNTIDLSTGGTPTGQLRDIGEGNDLSKARAVVTVAFNNLTSLQIDIVQADDAALTVNVTSIGSSGPILLANLTAGALFEIEINARIGKLGQRYMGLRYTVVGTAPTTGSVFADFGLDYQDGKKFYPSGFLVS